ncbi:hypothetical protein SRHO_G00018710 [Serrasalmus rhombeus]
MSQSEHLCQRAGGSQLNATVVQELGSLLWGAFERDRQHYSRPVPSKCPPLLLYSASSQHHAFIAPSHPDLLCTTHFLHRMLL